jgi:acylaminoacyl-peptidase
LVDGSIKTINFNLAVAEQESDTSDSSQTLLCLTSNGDAVVSQSEPNRPPMIGIIPSSFLTDDDTKVQQSLLLPPLPCVTATAKFDSFRSTVTGSSTTHLVSITPSRGEVTSVVQGILLLPTNEDGVEEENIPLIVVPHGGPHSCTTLSYTPSYAYLCEHGKYAILHVNYRGSAGFGQAPLESLAGNIGSQDIDDVYQLTRRVLDSFTGINPSRVGICGGSHGGFLAGHAIGQNPELFKVAAMRNPVCNVATMVTPTDIPDWCYVEALGPGNYDWTTYKGPTPDELTKMWEASPMAHIDNVVSPTLLAIGKSDKRVPPSQGIEYYHALRSKGVKTKLLLYDDDDHAIDKVQSEADHWINIKQWFDEHI